MSIIFYNFSFNNTSSERFHLTNPPLSSPPPPIFEMGYTPFRVKVTQAAAWKMRQKREPRLMRSCKFSSELLYNLLQTAILSLGERVSVYNGT